MIEIEESGFNDLDWKPAPSAGTGTGEPLERRIAQRLVDDGIMADAAAAALALPTVMAVVQPALEAAVTEAEERGRREALTEAAEDLIDQPSIRDWLLFRRPS